jgi:hypothetical protein
MFTARLAILTSPVGRSVPLEVTVSYMLSMEQSCQRIAKALTGRSYKILAMQVDSPWEGNYTCHPQGGGGVLKVVSHSLS